MTVCVVVPTYNEVLNICDLAKLILKDCPLPGLEICVVDDASPDGTADAVEAMEDPRVRVIRRSHDRGYGRSCNAGISYALLSRAEFVVLMDADFTHQPITINKMLEAAKEADLVIGSRYLGEKPGMQDWPGTRKIISKVARAYIRTVTGVPVLDPTGGFRCWRADFLGRMPLDTLQSKGYAYLYETLFRAWRLGARVKEVEALYVGRMRGESKISASVVREALWIPLRLRLLSLLEPSSVRRR